MFATRAPVTTTVSSLAAEIVDVLQIPAVLRRQTDLLLAVGETCKAIIVKKGQFWVPWEMGNVADKLTSTCNENIMLCERGTSFGYTTPVTALIAAMRADPQRQVATPVLRCDEEALGNFLEDRRNGRVGATTVVQNSRQEALYFSKEVLPFTGGKTLVDGVVPVFHHVGLYA